MALAIIGSAIPNIINADIKDVKDEISRQAGEDLVLAEIALAIAKSESGFEEDATNPKSTATGIYQFLIGTWKHYKCEGTRWDARDNITCALDVMKKRGWKDWNASKYLWYPKLSKEAKQRIKFGKEEDEEYRKVVFAGGLILVDKRGNILNEIYKIWYNLDNKEIPFI